MEQKVKENKLETLVCEHCHHINVVSIKPYKRRKKVLKTISVEQATWDKLKEFCIPYKSFNNGISMMLYEIDKIRIDNLIKMQSKDIPLVNISADTGE